MLFAALGFGLGLVFTVASTTDNLVLIVGRVGRHDFSVKTDWVLITGSQRKKAPRFGDENAAEEA